MAVMVFSPPQARSIRHPSPQRLVRVSGTSSPYQGNEDIFHGATGLQITPIVYAKHSSQDRLPGPNFSAQLLTLGLNHGVDGLVQKAHDQLDYQGAEPHSAQKKASRHYEHAQDYFIRDRLHMVERQL
jgi:hypothetical protein